MKLQGLRANARRKKEWRRWKYYAGTCTNSELQIYALKRGSKGNTGGVTPTLLCIVQTHNKASKTELRLLSYRLHFHVTTENIVNFNSRPSLARCSDSLTPRLLSARSMPRPFLYSHANFFFSSLLSESYKIIVFVVRIIEKKKLAD